MLELKVKHININGYEKDGCRQLYEYEWFVEKIRQYSEETDIKEAVEKALNEMPRDFTIRDMLEANRSEVLEMSLFEYDEAEHMALTRQEGYEEGRLEGLQEGQKKGREEGRLSERITLLQRLMETSGLSITEAAKMLGLSEEELKTCRTYMENSE